MRGMRSLVGLVGAGVVLAATSSASAQYGPLRADLPSRPLPEMILASEVASCPPGYHPESRVRSGPVIGGGIATGVGVLLVGYGIGSKLADSSGGEAAGTTDEGGGPGSGGEAFMIMGGMSLAAGLPLLIYGLASPRDVYVRDSAPRVAFGVVPTPKNPRLSLAVTF